MTMPSTSSIVNAVLVLACAATISISASALDEPLPRRGMLGAQLTPVDEEIRSALELGPRQGVQILDVMPESAALAAGLKANDVVLSVNDTEIAGRNALADFVATVGSHKGGEEVALLIMRGNEKRTLTARLTPMPQETYPDFDTEYGFLTVDGARHRTIVTKPKGQGPFPAVLFLQGLGCSSIDAWFKPDEHVRQLLAGFTDAGFVTVRAEKRGVGDSEGAPCNEMDFQTELRGHQAALTYTHALDYTSDVFIFGHSMGGVFAPLVSAGQDVAGAVAFGTIGKPLSVYYAETVERQLKLSGANDASITRQMETCNEFIALFFGERRTPGEISARDPKFKTFLSVRDADATHFHGVHYTFWHQLDGIDKAEAWSKNNAPALLLYGKADYAASREDHPYIRDAVNAAQPGNATYIELDGIGHGFESAATQQETMRNRFAGDFNPIVVETTVNWMRKRLQP